MSLPITLRVLSDDISWGSSEFYPPSPNAISYLRDPSPRNAAALGLVGQYRGLLFAAVLFPFRERILELGVWYGGLVITSSFS